MPPRVPPGDPAQGAQPESGSPDLIGLDQLVRREADRARRAHGLAPLHWSRALAAVAAGHSRDMAARGYFDHQTPEGITPNDRAEAAGVSCVKHLGGGRSTVGVSENLYTTSTYRRFEERQYPDRVERVFDWYSAPEIARLAVDAWLGSPGHRDNLLNARATSAAIGTALSPSRRVYITHVLC